MIGRKLPVGMGYFVKAVVERRLRTEKVHKIVAVSFAYAAHHSVLRRCVPNAFGKYISVGKLAFFGFFCLQKPWVSVRRVTRHKVKQNFNALFVSLVKEVYKILVCAVAGRNLFVVANIVACVHKRRIINRIQPYCITAQISYIVKFFDNSVDVADTVAVGIVKALRIDFIKHSVVKPIRHKSTSFHKKFFITVIVSFLFCIINKKFHGFFH